MKNNFCSCISEDDSEMLGFACRLQTQKHFLFKLFALKMNFEPQTLVNRKDPDTCASLPHDERFAN